MNYPHAVKIVEVGPRDGLQNEKINVPTDIKIEFIDRLSRTGLQNIEVTSFVSARSIPQLSDNKDVFEGISRRGGVQYSALVPNTTGLSTALCAGVTDIAIFTSASEQFCQRNINCSIDESLTRFRDIFQALPSSVKVRGYVSCALGCPYEGAISSEKVVTLTQELIKMGCYEVSIGDTIGIGTPLKAARLFSKLLEKIPASSLAAHFHDTYGQAIANIFATMQLGISTFDASVSGLGGCPYAKGATGNVATEDVVFLLHESGIATGLNLQALIKAGNYICKHLNISPRSKVNRALSHR